MQSEFGSDMQMISTQSSYNAQKALSVNEKPRHNTMSEDENFAETLLAMKGQPGTGGRRRLSSTHWQFILLGGDLFLLVALSGLLLIFQHIPQASRSEPGLWNANFLWVCLALVSWGLASNVAQPQNISNALNHSKSLGSTIFTLVLMYFFWIIFSDLLLGIGFAAAAWFELFFLALAVPAFTAWRVLFVEVMNLPRFRPRAVVVGVNPSGAAFAMELQRAKHGMANILGFIGKLSEESSEKNELPILGGQDTLRSLAQNSQIDMIIMALDYRANPQLFKEAIEAASLGIAILPMAVFYESSTGKVPVEHVGDQWYTTLQPEYVLSPLYLCWRKTLDIVFGLCGLLILCLVLPILALVIYLDSPGPIFYSQERVGFRGKSFRIYKFRSMYTDAEAEGLPQWANKHDKRVTRVGRFLRATHLDEVPQLFNVLRGDMSLIGPRPERAEFVARLEKNVPFYRHRLTVKPGLTGWAQVKYHYARTDDDAVVKLQYDLYYIRRQSFMLDLFIILKTVAEILSLRGS